MMCASACALRRDSHLEPPLAGELVRGLKRVEDGGEAGIEHVVATST